MALAAIPEWRLASEPLSALAETLAARPPSIHFDPHATRVDPYQALISTASYQTAFDKTGAMLSGYDLTGAAGPTLRTFQYGVDGMPSRITYGSTSVDSYYDDTGTRVLKYGAQTTVYVGPHFEVRNGVRHRYVFANGARIALLTPTDTYYFHGDHLGSTRAITNGAGTAVWTGSYEPFGRLSSETGTRVSPYLFTGQELDGETGLYYFGARYYDPSSGMFTSADSVLARPYDPQSLNRYAYVGGKPLSRFDPDGHNWLSDFGDWLGKGLRWMGEHSSGGFATQAGSVNWNGDVELLGGGPDGYTDVLAFVGIGLNDPATPVQDSGPSPTPGTGSGDGWVWLVEGGVVGPPSHGMHGADTNCLTHGQGIHPGGDWPAPSGTRIRSPAHGVIRFAQSNNATAGGWVIVEFRSGGFGTIMHMALAEGIEAGLPVVPGLVLGTSNNSGLSTGPHLHFEFTPSAYSLFDVYDHKGRVDPWTGFLQKLTGSQ